MAVAPRFAAHVLGSAAHPVHTLEIYLDYVCPFSAKLFNRVYNDVKPIIDSKFSNKVQNESIQAPFGSTLLFATLPFSNPTWPLVNPATLAHMLTSALQALFENQVNFFDVNVLAVMLAKIYKRLSALAAPLDVDEQQIYKLLTISDKPIDGAYNTGNQVTGDLKLHVKAARLVGVHVSPTVIFDGIVDNSVSSAWSVAQWEEWLARNVV
ncbi:unnamed protein product [Tuber aestivum]|uniref:Thioredoxin-like fold domain-containing protein n=1 Tax=Tuber aestivum TaxID=59557 RepID=A0A292Q0I8_9PEZI|nr:unnamed protein product [Tuber aestivum]